MIKVRSLGGIFFKCREPEKLAAWYKKHMGFELDAPFCASFDMTQAVPGDKIVWGAFKKDTEYFKPSENDFMLNFIVDDVAGLLKQVEQGGAVLIDQPVTDEFGTFGWFIDPEGFKVELWSPASQK